MIDILAQSSCILDMGKLWPLGQMLPAGPSNPAIHTLVQEKGKTDVSRSVSCITTLIVISISLKLSL